MLHYDEPPCADPVFLYILTGIALFILIIACLNFVNLAIARASSRIKEIGVRKVVGAMRRQLMGQFWGEALLLSGAALVLGVGLAAFCLPRFNTLAGQPLTLDLHTNWTTGVVKDFHFISLHYPVGPLVLHLHPERNIRYLFARLEPTDVPATLDLLEATWRTLVPDLVRYTLIQTYVEV